MSQQEHPTPAEYHPMKMRTIIVFISVGIAAIVGVAVYIAMSSRIPAAPAGPAVSAADQADIALRRVQLRVDIIRNILGVAAAVGAVYALGLALRRQYAHEHADQRDHLRAERTHELQTEVARSGEKDATERRITELQLKAADQLGSEKAAVRLAGLYALERLAQDNPAHRRVVVEIICAYLRMPHPAFPAIDPRVGPDFEDELAPWAPSQAEELVVRATAQEMLTRHLREKKQTSAGRWMVDQLFWLDVTTNLAGAVLKDFDGKRCTFPSASFHDTRFIGDAIFSHASFPGQANFIAAEFTGRVTFSAAAFESPPLFRRNYFSIPPDFHGVRVSEPRAGAEVDVPEGWKLVDDGDRGYIFVNGSDPRHSVPIVPDVD